jgi:hypothetical protein
LDVDDDGEVAPLDALLIINTLNRQGARPLDGDRPRPLSAPFYDTSRDDHVSSLDALLVINWLNRDIGEGEPIDRQAIGRLASEEYRHELPDLLSPDPILVSAQTTNRDSAATSAKRSD